MKRVKGVKRFLMAITLLPPAWLLCTESGLRAIAAAAERITDGRLTIEKVEGRLAGDIVVTRLAWRQPGVDVEIDHAEVDLGVLYLLIGRIQAEYLEVGTLAVTTHETPRMGEPHKPLTVRAPLPIAVSEGHLAAFRLRLPGWDRDWGVTDSSFAAVWKHEWFNIPELRTTTAEAGTLALRGRIAIVDDQLQIEKTEVRGPGTIHVDGAMAVADVASNQLDVDWTDLHWPGARPLPFSSAKGSGHLAGPWRNYAYRVQAQVELAGIPGALRARGRADLHSLTVQEGTLEALAGVIGAEGKLTWTGGIGTQLAVRWDHVDPGHQWAEWPGLLNGQAKLNAHWHGAASTIEFDGAFSDSQLRGYPFALQAVGHTEDKKVVLKELALQSGASKLHARGQLLPEMGLTGDLQSTDLRSLWAGLSGRASLAASASGPFTAPRLSVKGTVDQLSYQKYKVVHGMIDAHYSATGRSQLELQLTDVLAAVPLRQLSASGEGTRANHRLRLEVEGRGLSGDERAGQAVLAFTGGERAGGWSGQLVEARVLPPKGEAWALEEAAGLRFARAQFDTEPVCLASGDSRACFQLGFAPGKQRVAFRTRAFDLQHLRAWLPPEWNVTGTLSGSAAVHLSNGEIEEVRSDLEASAGVVEGGGVKMAYGPGELHVEPDGDRLRAHVVLRPAGGEIDGEVWISPGRGVLDRPMLGDLKLQLPDLSWLPVLSPEIAAAQGALDAKLGVSGTPRSPSLDGQVHLTGGRVQLTTPGIELTDLTASFERGKDAPLLLHAQGKSGDGQLAVEGTFKTLQPKLAGEVTIKGDNVLGLNRSDIRAWLSPDLKLVLDGRAAKLTGVLGVPHAEITPHEINARGVAPSGDQVIIEEAEAEAGPAHGIQVESEVKIALGDNVRFDGLGLKTQLTGAITALDDPQRPTRARGELELKGGRYKAYGQDLSIETGRLLFNGGVVTDPAIDITAVRKPREDIKVGLHARGTLDKPEFSLFSEPAMSQEEQLSWLVLGRSLSGTLDTGARTQLSGAAMSLGLTGGSYLAQQLAPRLGLDEVSIAAKPGETADLARLTIGKYISPKLFVSYGYGLFQPGHFFRMQYDLSKRWKLIGESGAVQGGDVQYTIER